MHVFIELWTPKPNWESIGTADRGALMQRLGEVTAPVIQAGAVEVLGWGEADASIDHPESHRYFAVWRAPRREALDRLREVIAREGWYDYFEQVNVTGELSAPEVVIGQHLAM
jgi:hypothetical protein